MQTRYMPDGMDFVLSLQQNDPKFVLQSYTANGKYKIKIEKCALWMRQVNLSPSVVKGHEVGFESQNGIIAYNGHRSFHWLVKTGGYEFIQDDAFCGTYPKMVILVLWITRHMWVIMPRAPGISSILTL